MVYTNDTTQSYMLYRSVLTAKLQKNNRIHYTIQSTTESNINIDKLIARSFLLYNNLYFKGLNREHNHSLSSRKDRFFAMATF